MWEATWKGYITFHYPQEWTTSCTVSFVGLQYCMIGIPDGLYRCRLALTIISSSLKTSLWISFGALLYCKNARNYLIWKKPFSRLYVLPLQIHSARYFGIAVYYWITASFNCSISQHVAAVYNNSSAGLFHFF